LVESAVSIFTDKETEAQKENVIRARYFRLWSAGAEIQAHLGPNIHFHKEATWARDVSAGHVPFCRSLAMLLNLLRPLFSYLWNRAKGEGRS
jgi:hypothetical protein